MAWCEFCSDTQMHPLMASSTKCPHCGDVPKRVQVANVYEWHMTQGDKEWVERWLDTQAAAWKGVIDEAFVADLRARFGGRSKQLALFELARVVNYE